MQIHQFKIIKTTKIRIKQPNIAMFCDTTTFLLTLQKFLVHAILLENFVPEQNLYFR